MVTRALNKLSEGDRPLAEISQKGGKKGKKPEEREHKEYRKKDTAGRGKVRDRPSRIRINITTGLNESQADDISCNFGAHYI